MIELELLKHFLRVEGDDQDDVITALEEGAVAAVERFTGRTFREPTSVVEVFDGSVGAPLILREKPMPDSDGADQLVIETRSSLDGEWEEVEAGDYERDGFLVYHKSSWPIGNRLIRASYVAGYEEGMEPKPVQIAVMQTVSDWYEHRENTNAGMFQVAELPLRVRELLGPYRLVQV